MLPQPHLIKAEWDVATAVEGMYLNSTFLYFYCCVGIWIWNKDRNNFNKGTIDMYSFIAHHFISSNWRENSVWFWNPGWHSEYFFV